MPELAIRRLAAGDEAALGALIARAPPPASSSARRTRTPSGSPGTPSRIRAASGSPRATAHRGRGAAGDQDARGGPGPSPAGRRPGAGREGIEIERERGAAEPAAGVLPEDAAAHAFLEATGFTFHSTLWDLDLDRRRVAWPRPPGRTTTRTRPIDRGATSGRSWRCSTPRSPTTRRRCSWTRSGWHANQDEAPFRDEDLLLLEGPSGELDRLLRDRAQRGPDGGVEPRGEIWTVGVRPERQGRGYGRQLLRWGVEHLRAVGVETVTLSVNGRNPRALGLYEAEGFHRTSPANGGRDRYSPAIPKGTP